MLNSIKSFYRLQKSEVIEIILLVLFSLGTAVTLYLLIAPHLMNGSFMRLLIGITAVPALYCAFLRSFLRLRRDKLTTQSPQIPQQSSSAIPKKAAAQMGPSSA